MTNSLNWMKNAADSIAATMLAAMFITFGLQIVSRYLFNAPLGWTVEVCLTLWLWLVFWASAFCVKESDHIRFDVLYLAAPHKVQRIFSIIAALGVIVGFLYSFLPTLDYILFYKIKKSAILRIRLDYVFSIYGVFVLALIVRYSWRLIAHLHPGLYKKYCENDDQEHDYS